MYHLYAYVRCVWKTLIGRINKVLYFPLLFLLTSDWIKLRGSQPILGCLRRRLSKPWRERGPAASQAYTRELRPLLKTTEFALSR